MERKRYAKCQQNLYNKGRNEVGEERWPEGENTIERKLRDVGKGK